MKNNFAKYLFFLVLIFLVACQEESFENPAARKVKFFNDFQTTLLHAESGWIMQYFASPQSAGYNFFLDFLDNSQVIIGGQTPATAFEYEESESQYGLTVENGPILNFITYNGILHPFAEPDRTRGSEGDFEFVIVDFTDEFIQLRGKKTDAVIQMIKLPLTSSGKEYVIQADEMKSTLFHPQIPYIYLEVDEKKYSFAGGFSSVFQIVELDNGTADVQTIPFVATPDGFRLYTSFNANGKNVQEFRVNPEKTELFAIENSAVRMRGIPFLPFFLEDSTWLSGISWRLDSENLGADFGVAYRMVVEGVKNEFNEEFNYFFFTFRSDRDSQTLSFLSGNRYSGTFDLKITLKNDTEEVVFVNKATMDRNGEVYLDKIFGFQEMLNLLFDDSFTVTAEVPLCPTVLKLTSIANPKNWFQIKIN
jgi:hypothetical protein